MSLNVYKPLPSISSPTPSIAVDDDDDDLWNGEMSTNLDEVLPVLKRRIRRQLQSNTSLLERPCEMDIRYMCKCCYKWAPNEKTLERYCKKLVDFQFMEMYKNVLVRADVKRLFSTVRATVEGDNDKNKAKDRKKEDVDNETTLELVRCLSTSVMNVTDKNVTLCERCLEVNVHELLFEYLKHEQLLKPNPEKAIVNSASRMLLILLNVVHRVTAARDIFRGCDAINILQQIRDGENVLVKMSALIVQAYLINEEENEKLISNAETFKFLMNRLSCSIQKKPYYALISATPSEAIAVINKLAVNDSNKEKIIEAGALPHYVKLMEDRFGAEVQKEAAHGLWTLGFKCRDRIIKEPGCIDGLKRLLKHSDEKVRFEAEGALWTIEDKQSQPVQKTEKVDSVGHVFISYQRKTSKGTVLKIRDSVVEAGFKVWFDDSDLVGNCMEEMATGVHEASVMLLCLSQNYQESSNCRAGRVDPMWRNTKRFRKKAHQCLPHIIYQKPIIPIRVQPLFNPDAPWLGLLLGNELVIDFSAEHLITAAMDKLIRTLEHKLQRGGTMKKIELSATHSIQDSDVTTRSLTSHEQTTTDSVLSWTQSDVTAWIVRRKIRHVEQWFKCFNGHRLLEFRRMNERAPETFYAHLLKGGLQLIDVLDICEALRDLS